MTSKDSANISEKRILSILKAAMKSLQGKQRKLHFSMHWEKIAYRKFSTINLINFRDKINTKDNLSQGLDINKNDLSLESFVELQNEIGFEYIYKNLLNKNIGNSPTVFKFKNKLADSNIIRMIAWLYDLENMVDFQKIIDTKNKIPIFLEIGGGYGAFAQLLLSNFKMKLISIDLPQANALTTFYLSRHFPDKKFFLFDDYAKKGILKKSDIAENDIIIIPNNSKLEEEIKIDFSINARSMMEMNKKAINYYFELIEKHSNIDSLFLNINRYEKESSGQKIRLSEYPYDNHWERLISKVAFDQKHIHMLLTKRIKNTKNGNIKKTLKEIDELGSHFYKKREESISLSFRTYLIYFIGFLVRTKYKIINFLRK